MPPAAEHLGVLEQEVMIMSKWETKEALLFLNSMGISPMLHDYLVNINTITRL